MMRAETEEGLGCRWGLSVPEEEVDTVSDARRGCRWGWGYDGNNSAGGIGGAHNDDKDTEEDGKCGSRDAKGQGEAGVITTGLAHTPAAARDKEEGDEAGGEWG